MQLHTYPQPRKIVQTPSVMPKATASARS